MTADERAAMDHLKLKVSQLQSALAVTAEMLLEAEEQCVRQERTIQGYIRDRRRAPIASYVTYQEPQ